MPEESLTSPAVTAWHRKGGVSYEIDEVQQ